MSTPSDSFNDANHLDVDNVDGFEPGRFASAFQRFLENYQQLVDDAGSSLRERVATFLGCDVAGLPTVVEKMEPSELPNVQLALEAISDDPASAVVGLPFELGYRDDFSLASFLAGRYRGFRVEACAPEYVNVPISADDTLPCVQIALWFVELDGKRAVTLVRQGNMHGSRAGLNVEVVAASHATASAVLTRVRELMQELNVFRGKLLTFAFNQYGMMTVKFHKVPEVARQDVILPEADLEAIERHTIGVERRATQLLAAGRHLKRGLLLYGPPGTGKTYSLMYLCNLMPNRTTIIVSGMAMGSLGAAVALARTLQPASVVLEDVDLIAADRASYANGIVPPFLFQLLNEMDGLAEDVDIIFALTTNRVDILEPALAGRPGRIDQAVEFKLPDPEHRRRLFELYLRGIAGDPGNLDTVVAGTEGVSAAFVKELVRRAVLLAAEGDHDQIALRPGDLDRALTDMHEHGAPVLRALLGATTPGRTGSTASQYL